VLGTRARLISPPVAAALSMGSPAQSPMLQTGVCRYALVIGADTLSKITDYTDRTTCVLFADGAGAVVLGPTEPGRGFLSFELGADGRGSPLIRQAAGGSRLVRSALIHVLEDPPFSLGRSQLAVCLLPQLAEISRGQLLQRALLSAIEGLRPSQETTLDNQRSWPYLICRAEYLDGLCRREAERRMALSTSSYTRAKRQALGRIAAVLPLIVVQLTYASLGATNWSALVAQLRLLVEIASVSTPHLTAAQADQHLLARMIDLQETLREVLRWCVARPTSSDI